MYEYEAEAEAEASQRICFHPTTMEELYQVLDNAPMDFDRFMQNQPIDLLHLFHLPTCSASAFQESTGSLDDKAVLSKGKLLPATERARRIQLNIKYTALSNLIPNPTKKPDKSSIVEDAIEHIKQLFLRLGDLKILVEKKRKERGAGAGEVAHGGFNESSSMRTSWLQRKSRDTEFDDQVTINLVQRKKNNRLLNASKALQDLHLDPHHVAGGRFGDFNAFFFYIKVRKGSCVCASASAIANKLIEL